MIEVLDNEDSHSDIVRPASPAFSTTSDQTDMQKQDENATKSPVDSSLLLKLTINKSMLLAGRPTAPKSSSAGGRLPPRRRQFVSFAVVQVLSNVLIMFQSIENPDASGTKTLHVSLDKLSASVNTEFDNIPTSLIAPMIGPTGAEFRVVYTTENLGCVVSNDLSLDCEHLKSCLTPNDMSILASIVQTMLERLRGVKDPFANEKSKQARNLVSSLIQNKKRGTGIATNIRVEVQTISFVLLRAFRSKYGTPEFLAFNVKEMKARLGGCVSALSGECTALFSVDFFNADVSAWEYAIEPFPVTLSVDQMPNELVSSNKSANILHLSSLFLMIHTNIDSRPV